MNYKIYVNEQLFKSIATDDGYNYVDVVKEVLAAKDKGELSSFNVDAGLSIKVVQD